MFRTAGMMSAAVLVGALLPVQFAINAELTVWTRSPAVTAAVSYAVGALMLLAGLLWVHRGRVPFARLAGAPHWSWLGGVAGSAYVLGSIVLTRELGTATAVSLVVGAQVLGGLTLDHFGVLGVPRRPLTARRVLAFGLVVAALAVQVR